MPEKKSQITPKKGTLALELPQKHQLEDYCKNKVEVPDYLKGLALPKNNFQLGTDLWNRIDFSAVRFFNNLPKKYIHKDDCPRPLIVVDAGHGGVDKGAINRSVSPHIYEKTLTLSASESLAQTLYSKGANVVLSRNFDCYPDLDLRREIATSLKANFLISIHYNSSPVRHKNFGSEVYTYPNATCPTTTVAMEMSDRLAKVDHTYVNQFRGTFEKKLKIIKNAEIPSTLVELAFIQDPKARNTKYRNTQLEVISTSILNFLK